MAYLGIEIRSEEPTVWNDVALALLSEHPFESFEEKDDVLWAYIPMAEFREDMLNALDDIRASAGIETKIHELEKTNWNAVWESQFDPVIVENICFIYAPFHPKPKTGEYAYTMQIMPKMAFGTGHHATTWMMIKAMHTQLDFTGKSVLDMGCGTGILALFARIKGAKTIHAIDIDDWAIDNTMENFAANNAMPPEFAKCGDRNAIPKDARYDIILANINRNVLLEDLPTYAKHLKPNGQILLSGFYPHDVNVLSEVFGQLQFVEIDRLEHKGWCCILLD
ncbi:MAG: 50S ribosomal protein L11 methyltransferase [Cryomorphaceae bacterium]|nr:50S ribosomal protein L11 methyltransferase [Cryomorphaceae bacterium]